MRFHPRLCSLGLLAAWIAFGAAGSDGRAEIVVWSNSSDNGQLTPIGSGNLQLRYGDSGWFGIGSDAPVELARIDLGLAVSSLSGTSVGSTDILFSLHDGAPGGLIRGTGDVLYSTVISGFSLPALAGGQSAQLDLSIDLTGISTRGGFNDFGWSVGFANFAYQGSIGFQRSTRDGQTAGFLTENAVIFNGSQWNLLQAGANPNTGVWNFRATLVAVPEPSSVVLMSLVGAVGLIGRRRLQGWLAR
jgi:hypothetical protein